MHHNGLGFGARQQGLRTFEHVVAEFLRGVVEIWRVGQLGFARVDSLINGDGEGIFTLLVNDAACHAQGALHHLAGHRPCR